METESDLLTLQMIAQCQKAAPYSLYKSSNNQNVNCARDIHFWDAVAIQPTPLQHLHMAQYVPPVSTSWLCE